MQSEQEEARRLRVLLVDDETKIVEGLKSMIDWHGNGYVVCGQARNGAEALEAARRLEPELIVTDIRMPRLDGLAMIARWRAEWPEARFMILTGHSDFEYARQAMQYGVRHYVLKPIEEKEVERGLRELASDIRAGLDSKQELAALREHSTAYSRIRARLQETATDEDSLPAPPSDEERYDLAHRVRAYIDLHAHEPLTLVQVAERFYVHPHYLSQLFHKKTGQPFLQYLTAVRMEHAKRLLLTTELKVYEISRRVGYEDAKYFSRLFERQVGAKPSVYKARERM
ncbi:response regulator [Paenibacillus sp. IB182496]|uniref:Response regulator n=1 Tax=Paenibacillus sabuli TaxID=2772509 RepID=A0A927GRZ9_9BACL|nr:response regulator [Paenibacillus sabuli]MBD2845520.1 response regulator [Paenibacillus sabuli]